MRVDRPDISTVIVSYNTRDLIKACLTSLLYETIDHSIEVIVVDNASTDGSCEMIRERFPSVCVLQTGDNLGFARAANLGIRASEGALVLLLNPDTVILDHAIDRLADFIHSSPSVGACCPMLLNTDGSYQRGTLPLPVLLSPLYEYSTLFERVPALARLLVPGWIDQPYQMHEVGYSSGACLLVKRACIQEVGLFDEDFFLYGEDVDWCRRTHERGWHIVYDPGSRVIHHEGGSQEPNLNRRLREMEGEVRYLRKWHGRAYAAGYRTLVWLLSLFRYVKLSAQRRQNSGDTARLSAYIAFYRTLLLGRRQIARPPRGNGSSTEGLAHHSESGQGA